MLVNKIGGNFNYGYRNNVISFRSKKSDNTSNSLLRSTPNVSRKTEQAFLDYMKRPDARAKLNALLIDMDFDSQQKLKENLAKMCTGALYGFDYIKPEEKAHIDRCAELEKEAKELGDGEMEVDGMKFIANKFVKHPVASHMGIYEAFEPEDFKYIKDKCVIDAGAGFGETSVILAQHNGNGKVLAFEPTSSSREFVVKNSALNNLQDRVEALPYGLSNFNGEAKFNMCENHPTSNTLSLENNMTANNSFEYKSEETIPVRTLDSIVEERPEIGKIGLIKVDIEGEERNFIDGAEEVLRTHKPICMLSIYHSPDDYFDLKPKMEKLGYKRFKFIKPDSRYNTTEMMIVCFPDYQQK